MRFRIKHEIPGRLRLKLAGRVPEEDIDTLVAVVSACPPVSSAVVYPRIAELAVTYSHTSPHARSTVLRHLLRINSATIEEARPANTGCVTQRKRKLVMDLAQIVALHFIRKWFVPMPLRTLWTLWSYRPFLSEGLKSLGAGRLDVPVLDMAAIGISFLKGDPATAGSTMFLLNVGETLQDYTRASSQGELIRSLMAVSESAALIEGDSERTVPVDQLRPGDIIAIRTGMPISIDGTVVGGVAMVNQSTLTGEPLAIERTVGDDVFAGTACEDGEIQVRVGAHASDTKLRSIVGLVEAAEKQKAGVQSRREHLADRIVPWNFLLAGVVALTTRNLVKTSAALMVDYSCALKLTSSIAVMSAMSQSVRSGFTVKGSKHFEAMANADTIVFDKTGTLTEATPKVGRVLPLGDWDSDEVLRLAACLEEHFPHPVARAVVNAAAEADLSHRERHAEVEYIVAHGIASSLDGQRCAIGSEHFIFEDEGVQLDEAEKERIKSQMAGCSMLFLAVGGKLCGVIGISDPLKEGVAESLDKLRKLGLKHIVMLTGDAHKTAAEVAAAAGITEFAANLLPDEKYAAIERMRKEGRHVVMVGDGVNDAAALSAANVGIAMASGTAIAREVADVTLSTGDLDAIVRLRLLSQKLMERMSRDFGFIMTFNSALLATGIAGVLTPQTSSLLHNGSTVALCLADSKGYDVE